MEVATIYTISNRNNGAVLYVGATIDSLQKRLLGHMTDGVLPLTRDPNVIPVIDRIESMDEDSAAEAEQYWIEQFRQWGFQLQNCTAPRRYNRGQSRIKKEEPWISIKSATVPYRFVQAALTKYYNEHAHETRTIAWLAHGMCNILDIVGDTGPGFHMTPEMIEGVTALLRKTSYKAQQ